MSTEMDSPQIEGEDDNEDKEGVGLSTSGDDGRLFRICEVLFSIALLAVSLVVEYVTMPLHMRAIPVQVVEQEESTIYIRNLILDEEKREESVSTTVLALVGMILPLVLQLAISSWGTRRRPYDVYNTICSYFVAVSITFLIVDVIKLYTGFLRPHFYEVCQPDDNYQFCTNDDERDSREIRDSFPSGHAGLSMSALGSLSLYLHHRFGVGSVSLEKANTREHNIARLWSFLSIFPVLLALYMGASRIHDDHHHPSDVVGGTAIGGVAAYFCHHVYFLE